MAAGACRYGRGPERLAAGYDREGETKPSNAYLERPATLSLLPDVAGSHLLDAGCGAGHLAEELSTRGASVVGLDASREMLAYARRRVPDADFVRADLGTGLSFGDGTLDGVASSLAFHYVEGWERLFRDLERVLVPGGWVVFSVQHLHADFEEYDDARNDHERERVSATWEAFGGDGGGSGVPPTPRVDALSRTRRGIPAPATPGADAHRGVPTSGPGRVPVRGDPSERPLSAVRASRVIGDVDPARDRTGRAGSGRSTRSDPPVTGRRTPILVPGRRVPENRRLRPGC